MIVLWLSSPVYAVTCTGSVCTFTTSDSYSTVNTAISGHSGFTFVWPTASTNYGGTLTFTCSGGNTYKGTFIPTFVPGSGVSPTSVLNFTSTNNIGVNVTPVSGGSFVSGVSGCHITGLWLKNLNMLVAAGSGISIDHARISGTLGATTCSTCHASIYFQGSGSTGQTGASVTFSTFGPGCTDLVNISTYSDGDGTCGSVAFQASAYSNNVSNNNWVGPIQEGIKILSSNVVTVAQNNTFENNDFSGIHRISIETQPNQGITNTIAYNDDHDQYNPDGGSFGFSLVNSTPPTSGATSPISYIVHDNVLISNVSPGPSCGTHCYIAYGIEHWGTAPQVYTNLIQGLWNQGIVFGGQTTGTPTSYISSAGSINTHIIQGPNMGTSGSGSFKNYIACETTGGGPIGTALCPRTTGITSLTGNMLSGIVSAQISAIASASPAGGIYGSPQTVTLSTLGTNTSIWYTTNGSTPVPGTATLYTAPFVVTPTAGGVVIKAVGMWGQGGNALSYPSGYGFVPSAVVTNTYFSPSGPANLTLQGPTTFGGKVIMQ